MTSNALVPMHSATPDTESEWNLPPELDPSLPTGNARRADRDAARARRQGDTSFAVIREEDAADQRQTVWDWGDFRTWAWIAAMFFGFLLVTAFVYFMPHGTHNQSDGGNSGGAPTPTIRVY